MELKLPLQSWGRPSAPPHDLHSALSEKSKPIAMCLGHHLGSQRASCRPRWRAQHEIGD